MQNREPSTGSGSYTTDRSTQLLAEIPTGNTDPAKALVHIRGLERETKELVCCVYLCNWFQQHGPAVTN